MFGDGEAEPSKDHAVLLCWEACKMGLPLVLAHKLTLLDFETRKDAAQVRHTHALHAFRGKREWIRASLDTEAMRRLRESAPMLYTL